MLYVNKKHQNFLKAKCLGIIFNVNKKPTYFDLILINSPKIAKILTKYILYSKMKQKQPILIALVLASFSFAASAQQSVNASGNNAAGAGGSSSYSVGQVVYTTNSGTTGKLTQGVQQPYEISTLGIDELPELSLQFSAYPNPTTNVLTLAIENYSTDTLKYQLFDITGKVIASNKLTGSRTNIDMNNYQAAIYFLKITENNKEIKTFKIIKK